MKNKKSLHGFLADKNNPISREEILRGLKEDRWEADEDKVESTSRLGLAWKKYCSEKSIKGTLNEYLEFLHVR